MFLSSLLAVSEQTTEIIKWISVAAVVLTFGVIALIGLLHKRQYDAKRIAFAGICVSMSFTLAVVKISPVQYGGSITLASFVPILIYAYVYGVGDGLLVGFIHGLLNFIEDPYILTPVTFVFDYILPFSAVGVMGLFGKMRRKENGVLPIVLGCICVFTLRFLCHLVSGMVFFSQGEVWVDFPGFAMRNALIYSFIYQCIYVPADALLATLVLIALTKTGVLDKLTNIMKAKKQG